MTHEVGFVVEGAGCPSCAARLSDVLDAVGSAAIEIDEAEDTASVRLRSHEPVSGEVVDHALEEASAGSVHIYRRRPDTWLVLS